MAIMPLIDEAICDGCGLCISVCRCGALVKVGATVKAVRVEECGWCGLCELVCPHGAIVCPFEVVIESEKD